LESSPQLEINREKSHAFSEQRVLSMAQPQQRTFQANTDQIQTLRIKKGWSVGELAERACCSTRTINSLMQGSPVLISTLSKLAKAFAVPVEDLLPAGAILLPNQGAIARAPGRIEVQIKYAASIHEFDETNQLLSLLTLLKSLIKAKDDIDVIRVESGSVLITLSMSIYDASSLCFIHRFDKSLMPGIEAVSATDLGPYQGLYHFEINSKAFLRFANRSLWLTRAVVLCNCLIAAIVLVAVWISTGIQQGHGDDISLRLAAIGVVACLLCAACATVALHGAARRARHSMWMARGDLETIMRDRIRRGGEEFYDFPPR